MTIQRQTIEDCLEEMGTPPIKKCIGCINIVPNPIPIENIKEAYERMTNKSWNEEYGEE